MTRQIKKDLSQKIVNFDNICERSRNFFVKPDCSKGNRNDELNKPRG